MRALPLLGCSFALAAACASNGDEINDITPPPGGKRDEGLATALDILRVANTVSVPDLRVVIWNNGINHSRLTMRDVGFVNAGAVVAARSLTSEASSHASRCKMAPL